VHVKHLLEAAISPLGVTTLVLMGGLLLSLRARASRRGPRLLMAGACLYLVWLWSPLAEIAIRSLEVQYPPLLQPPVVALDRIVVLAGYGETHPTIPVTSNVSPHTLCNLVEGLRLYHQMPGAKLLMAGGRLRQDDQPVAHIMADLLRALGVPADDILVEGQSQTTYENLLYVKGLLGTQPFVLVAAACDLPRAMAVGHKLGMAPVAAPACIWTLQQSPEVSVRGVVDGMLTPSLERLARLQWAFHEYVGLLWYKMLGRI
jgi:uncharacterized SAM-binding protein YcdF (DUF218 family)